MKRLALGAVIVLVSAQASAQSNPAALAAREWRDRNERAVLEELVEFLSIPNVTRDRAAIQRNAEFIVRMMARRGIQARPVTQGTANPIVFGEIRTPGATRTIAFYAHYDGQPVEETQWASPPFNPTLRTRPIDEGGEVVPLAALGSSVDPEARLYARSASDDKAPIMALMAAIDVIREAGLRLKSNIKFVFEGEEEALSPNLESMLTANRELFAADLWLIIDGPLHQTRRPLIYFGARGMVRLDVTVYGARTELHAGHYGNWAPNPALMLARLLASMRDDDGRVLIQGFYDDVEPLSDTERRAIVDAPTIDQDLMRDLWLGSTEGAPATLAEVITRPALTIRGLASARVGAQAVSVIPSTATASLILSLVKGMDPARTRDRVVNHIRDQGYFVVEEAPTPEVRRSHTRVAWVQTAQRGVGAVRTPMDLPVAREVIAIVEAVRGPAVKLPNMGGTLPLADIERPLGTRTITVPIVNHDNNQHSFDENLRIQNLWDGIELLAALLCM